MTDYIYWTLPMPVVASVGSSVTVEDIFKQSFGGTPAEATGMYLAYWSASDLAYYDFDYWAPNTPSLDRWKYQGVDYGAGFQNQRYYSTTNAANITLTMGNVIGPDGFVMIPTGWDQQGTITQYTEYHIMTIEPDLMLKTAGTKAPTAADIVKQAYLFSEKYGSPVNSNDCHYIAGAVAASAGATMPMFGNTQNVVDPSQNIESGFWRIAYRGSDPNPVANWQTLLKPGDIVRMGWTNGGFHTATILAISADKKTMTVYDNTDNGKIGVHDVTFDTITKPGSITIYRLTTDNYYLQTGSSLGESIAGSIFNDKVFGLAGDDKLFGYKGNDWLDGGTGADTMIGGIGNDTYIVDNAKDIIIEAKAAGTDKVLTSVSYTLAAGVEVEALETKSSTGKTSIKLTGNEFAQSLTGNAGNNVLNGKAGADKMSGLAGNDTYYVDNAKDIIVEAKGMGTDKVLTSVSYTLASGVEIENFATTSSAGKTSLNLTGNEAAQSLTGNAGNNTLDGKAGADTMSGLAGNDTYYIDNAKDVIFEAKGMGSDTVRTSVSYTLAKGVEVETFTTTSSTAKTALKLTGNEFAQSITGNAGANILNGKGGGDTLKGGLGDDVFLFDTTLGSSNIDTIVDFHNTTGDNDRIQLDDAIFAKLNDGVLSSANFYAGTTGVAKVSNDYIVYDTDSGKLYYDADGSGSGKAVQFALISGHPTLTAGDFFV